MEIDVNDIRKMDKCLYTLQSDKYHRLIDDVKYQHKIIKIAMRCVEKTDVNDSGAIRVFAKFTNEVEDQNLRKQLFTLMALKGVERLELRSPEVLRDFIHCTLKQVGIERNSTMGSYFGGGMLYSHFSHGSEMEKLLSPYQQDKLYPYMVKKIAEKLHSKMGNLDEYLSILICNVTQNVSNPKERAYLEDKIFTASERDLEESYAARLTDGVLTASKRSPEKSFAALELKRGAASSRGRY